MTRTGVSIAGRILFLCALSSLNWTAEGDQCSSALTNRGCTITIDRESPTTPLPIHVHSGQTVTIVVTKRPLEKITFDAKLSEVASPDPFATIFSSFLKPLGSVVISSAITGGVSKELPASDVQTVIKTQPKAVQDLLTQLNDILTIQKSATIELNSIRSAIQSAAQTFDTKLQQPLAGSWTVSTLTPTVKQLVCDIDASRDPTVDMKYGCAPATIGVGLRTLPNGTIRVLDDSASAVVKAFEAIDFSGVNQLIVDECRSHLNTVLFNESALDDNLKTIQGIQVSITQSAAALEAIDLSSWTVTDTKSLTVSASGNDRSASVTISATNTITKAATSLSTIVVTWGGTRWELSTGVLISGLPNRSFQNSPIISNGKPSLDSGGKVNTVVTQSKTIPTIVPIFLGHYSLYETLLGSRRFGLSLTGGVGVSPYSGSTDFGAGVSVEYRSLVLSPLAHFGRDLRLTNGLTVGQQLGSNPPTLSTERYWVRKLGFSLTYRLPIN